MPSASSSSSTRRSNRRPQHPGRGSHRLLDWVARLGAAGIEPAGIALQLSQGVTYSHARRLVDAGLLWRLPVNDGAGGVIAVTPRGAALARERDVAAVSPRGQAPSTGVHARAVSWLAARADTRGWPWLGPGALARDRFWTLSRDDGARHRPDLGLLIDDLPYAVEVELHAKAPARLDAILRAYRDKIRSTELHTVLYVVEKPHVERLVKRRLRRALLDDRATVGPLDEIVALVRANRKGQST